MRWRRSELPPQSRSPTCCEVSQPSPSPGSSSVPWVKPVPDVESIVDRLEFGAARAGFFLAIAPSAFGAGKSCGTGCGRGPDSRHRCPRVADNGRRHPEAEVLASWCMSSCRETGCLWPCSNLQRQTGTLVRKTRLPWNLRQGWAVELDTRPLFGRRTQRIGQTALIPLESVREPLGHAVQELRTQDWGPGPRHRPRAAGPHGHAPYAEPGCLGTSKSLDGRARRSEAACGSDSRSVRASGPTCGAASRAKCALIERHLLRATPCRPPCTPRDRHPGTAGRGHHHHERPESSRRRGAPPATARSRVLGRRSNTTPAKTDERPPVTLS